MSRRTNRNRYGAAGIRLTREAAKSQRVSGTPPTILAGERIVSVDVVDARGHHFVRLWRWFDADRDPTVMVRTTKGATGGLGYLPSPSVIAPGVEMARDADGGGEWTMLWFRCQACRDVGSTVSSIGMEDVRSALAAMADAARKSGTPRHAQLITADCGP